MNNLFEKKHISEIEIIIKELQEIIDITKTRGPNRQSFIKNESGKLIKNLKTIEHGKQLNKLGGFELMQAVFYSLKFKPGDGRLLEMCWDGIGKWED